MTEHEFEQRLRSWYRDQAEADGPVSSYLAASIWSIPDAEPMSRPTTSGWRRTLVLAAAAMLLVLLVAGAIAMGLQLLPWERNDIDPRPPAPDQPISWHLQPDTVMPAGRYYVDLATGGGRSGSAVIRVSFTLPTEWERVPIEGLLWGQSKWVNFSVPTNLYIDACGPEAVLRDPPVGGSAAELAAALAEVRGGWTIHDVAEVTLGGYSGMRVSMTAPSEDAECGDGRLLRSIGWPGFVAAMRVSEPVTLWILDVEDKRLVIWAGRDRNVTEAQKTELLDVVNSIEITYLAAVQPGAGRGSQP